MRADRLISLIMLLQTRGHMTAAQLARELEVSERTIYRDLDALSAAGVPVQAERGPGGGCRLLGSYRTELTGLTAAEVQALAMLEIPEPLQMLGLGEKLRSALLKLSASVPEALRQDEKAARARLHLDAASWSRDAPTVEHLQTIEQAIWRNQRLHLTVRLDFGGQIRRLVDPYGLVAKACSWYLVFRQTDTFAVHPLSRILRATPAKSSFERLKDFDLAAFWRNWCERVMSGRRRFDAMVKVSPRLFSDLPRYFGVKLKISGTPRGWVSVRLPFESFEDARTRLLGFGSAVQVISPRALRLSIEDFARQIVMLSKPRAKKKRRRD